MGKQKGQPELVAIIVLVSQLIVKSATVAARDRYFRLGFGPGRRSFFRYSRIASAVVSQFRPSLTPSSRPVVMSLRMWLVVKPLILAASAMEMRPAVRSSKEVLLAVLLDTMRV